MINELFGRLNKEGLDVTRSPVSAQALGAIIDLISENVISGKIAKDLFEIVWSEGGDPKEIVETRGMKQVTDTSAIEAAVDAVIAANPDKVEQAKAKPTMLGWFVGQVMKQTGGKANPQAVNELLKTQIGRLNDAVASRKRITLQRALRDFSPNGRAAAPIFSFSGSLTTIFFSCLRRATMRSANGGARTAATYVAEIESNVVARIASSPRTSAIDRASMFNESCARRLSRRLDAVFRY